VKDLTSIISPTFGAGCCRNPPNESREKVIKEKYGGVIPTIEIED